VAVPAVSALVQDPNRPRYTYEVGEGVQVKLEGATRWVDSRIHSREPEPETYTVQVPELGAGGARRDRTVRSVSAVMLRRVYRDMEVNVEAGDNASNWYGCVVLGLGVQPETYDIEIMEGFPGRTLKSVPTSLIRESEVRRLRGVHLREMFEENEVKKSQLFYVNDAAKRLREQKQREEAANRAAQAQDQLQTNAMHLAWEEMAKRAEKENKHREMMEAAVKAKADAKRAKLSQKEEKIRAERWARDEEEAATNPLAALRVKQRKLEQDRHEASKALGQQKLTDEQERAKAREAKRLKDEERVQETMEKMKLAREVHQVALHKVQTSSEAQAAAKESMKALEAVELGATRNRLMSQSDIEKLVAEDQKRYQATEEERVQSKLQRQQTLAKHELEAAVEELHHQEESAKTQSQLGGIRQRMRVAIREAEGYKVDAEALDTGRAALAAALSASAREGLKHAMQEQQSKELAGAIRDSTGKATEIDTLFSAITSTGIKMDVQDKIFRASELDEAKQALPEMMNQEFRWKGIRSRLQNVKNARKPENAEKVISKARDAGLPPQEVKQAQVELALQKSRTSARRGMWQAFKARDLPLFEAGITQAEASREKPWRVRELRRVLKRLKKQEAAGQMPAVWQEPAALQAEADEDIAE